MKRVATTCILILVLPGCFLFEKRERKYPWADLEVVTQEGYRVAYIDRGTVATGFLSLRKIHQLLATKIDEGCKHLSDTYQGPTYEEWLAVAKAHRWAIVDDVGFTATDGIQRAAGEHVPGKYDWIRVALWNRKPNQFGAVVWDGNPPPPWPADTPAWVIMENPAKKGEWRWGELDNPLAATAHELGHHVFGAKFEHGWKPPLRN